MRNMRTRDGRHRRRHLDLYARFLRRRRGFVPYQAISRHSKMHPIAGMDRRRAKFGVLR